MVTLYLHKYAALFAVVLALGIVSPESSSSQEIKAPVNQNEQVFMARTKQFNEFLDRFNYKTTFKGDPVDSAFRLKMPRENLINSLFDMKDNRITSASKEYSEKFISLKKAFVEEVIRNNSQIGKYSENIVAEAKSRVLLKGAPKNISIFLAQETIGGTRVKWVVLDVKGELFNFLKTDTAFIRFIPPSSNETDFMNLKRAMEDVNYLQYYASKEYSQDNLTLFFYLINTGTLKFEYTEEVLYHILDIPGWCMKIKEFNRNELNSGWLISDLFENSLERSTYIRSLK